MIFVISRLVSALVSLNHARKVEERLKSMTVRCEKQKHDPQKVERELGRMPF